MYTGLTEMASLCLSSPSECLRTLWEKCFMTLYHAAQAGSILRVCVWSIIHLIIINVGLSGVHVYTFNRIGWTVSQMTWGWREWRYVSYDHICSFLVLHTYFIIFGFILFYYGRCIYVHVCICNCLCWLHWEQKGEIGNNTKHTKTVKLFKHVW